MANEEQMLLHEEKPKRKKKRGIPIALIVIYAMTAFAGLFYVLYRNIPALADAYNHTVGAFVRRIMAYLTVLPPFSVAEGLLIASPVILGFLIYAGIRYHNKSLRDALVYCGSVLAVFCIVFQLFVFGFAPGYYGYTVDRTLGMERRDVSPEELYETAVILVQEINRANDDVIFLQNGFSVMPYTLSEMNERLIEAYDALSLRYDAVRNFYSKVKPVALSEGMSYTHITGVYTFFTGESNLNVNFPDYTLPFTAAHELAHQRGFAREDEANLIAFLACDASSDPYIRYSGYVGMYQYVMNALYRADKDLYREVYFMSEPSLRTEQAAYAEFFKKYEKSKVGEVSGAINNSYLQSQGTVGTKSYGMVVDLAVAYFRTEKGK